MWNQRFDPSPSETDNPRDPPAMWHRGSGEALVMQQVASVHRRSILRLVALIICWQITLALVALYVVSYQTTIELRRDREEISGPNHAVRKASRCFGLLDGGVYVASSKDEWDSSSDT